MWSGNEYRALRQFVDIIQTDTEKCLAPEVKVFFWLLSKVPHFLPFQTVSLPKPLNRLRPNFSWRLHGSEELKHF